MAAILLFMVHVGFSMRIIIMEEEKFRNSNRQIFLDSPTLGMLACNCASIHQKPHVLPKAMNRFVVRLDDG